MTIKRTRQSIGTLGLDLPNIPTVRVDAADRSVELLRFQ